MNAPVRGATPYCTTSTVANTSGKSKFWVRMPILPMGTNSRNVMSHVSSSVPLGWVVRVRCTDTSDTKFRPYTSKYMVSSVTRNDISLVTRVPSRDVSRKPPPELKGETMRTRCTSKLLFAVSRDISCSSEMGTCKGLLALNGDATIVKATTAGSYSTVSARTLGWYLENPRAWAMAPTVDGSPNPSPDTSTSVSPPNPINGAQEDGDAEGDMELEGVTEGLKLGLVVEEEDGDGDLVMVLEGEGDFVDETVGDAVLVKDLEGDENAEADLVLDGMDMVAEKDREGVRVRDGVRLGTPKLSSEDSVGLADGVLVSEGDRDGELVGDAVRVRDTLGVTDAVLVGDAVMLIVAVMERYKGSTKSAVNAG